MRGLPFLPLPALTGASSPGPAALPSPTRRAAGPAPGAGPTRGRARRAPRGGGGTTRGVPPPLRCTGPLGAAGGGAIPPWGHRVLGGPCAFGGRPCCPQGVPAPLGGVLAAPRTVPAPPLEMLCCGEGVSVGSLAPRACSCCPKGLISPWEGSWLSLLSPASVPVAPGVRLSFREYQGCPFCPQGWCLSPLWCHRLFGGMLRGPLLTPGPYPADPRVLPCLGGLLRVPS